MKKDKWTYNGKWIIFYFSNCFDISFETCGYFDNRPRINIGLIFFRLSLILPIRNNWTDECDPPKFGIAIHNETLWIYKGGKGNIDGGNKLWTWDIPFITKQWMRTSVLLNDETWETESNGNRKSFYDEKWDNKKKTWTYNYHDNYDGEIIPTKITHFEREWRPKWLTWTKLFNIVKRTIEVEFSKECGSGKTTWKGGVISCSYNLLPNEHPINCIKRMEFEKTF